MNECIVATVAVCGLVQGLKVGMLHLAAKKASNWLRVRGEANAEKVETG